MLEVPLNRSSKLPLYRQIAIHLERMIQVGALSVGEQLPGTRRFADNLGVSRMTVIEAYRVLEDQGLLIQRGRSGAYVTGASRCVEKGDDPDVALWIMNGEAPTPNLMPVSALTAIVRDVLCRDVAVALGESPLEGFPDLRHALVAHGASRGIPADWRDVVLTSGGRQGLMVSFASLRRVGVRTVLMDWFNYPDAPVMAREAGLRVLPFPRLGDPREAMECIEADGAVYLVPSFANPTGATMDGALRESILALARRRSIWIVEDDAYGELRYGDTSVPALRALDDGHRILYLGSFSQALFPGLRLGYALVPDELRPMFLLSLNCCGGPPSSLIQHVVRWFITSGGLASALERTRVEMACRMGLLCSELGYRFSRPFLRPQGGIYLWFESPGIDGDQAQDLAREEGVLVSSGRRFALNGESVSAVRLSVSGISAQEIPQAAAALSHAWKGALDQER
ncbi:MAG: GntR family transcriptional regulator [Dethiosulfovibrio peptidovorans]|nr:MAG: GntR family transcriptional regulator [Dethiosulfovibrio peptidovorans]